jgi:hypothetical protein
MVMDDYIACPWVMHSTGVGICEKVDIRVTDQKSDTYSRRFHWKIQELSETLLKDLSTVRFKPHRLWQWSAMAMKLVEKIG